jgi:hypothetical protein
MKRRSSSGSGWPSDTGIDGSSPRIGEESQKGSGPRSSGSDASASNPGQSKTRTGKKRTPPSAPGKEGRQISPDEIAGEAPEVPRNSLLTELVLEHTEGNYSDPTVRPMGFRNGKAPKYASSICYRNAAITMLLNIPYFANWVNGSYPSLRDDDALPTAMDNMQKLAEVYWAQPNSLENTVSTIEAIDAKQKRLDEEMRSFWTHFVEANPKFTDTPRKTNQYRQEDAALFLMTFFNSVLDMLQFK